nr:MAG TPA: hypothetical protein [Caudoviricetes sp.]DAX31834.1 MAG TPA: hypothetical protein [Caudoviricetes sp.]
MVRSFLIIFSKPLHGFLVNARLYFASVSDFPVSNWIHSNFLAGSFSSQILVRLLSANCFCLC